jgi:hypothetical protein
VNIGYVNYRTARGVIFHISGPVSALKMKIINISPTLTNLSNPSHLAITIKTLKIVRSRMIIYNIRIGTFYHQRTCGLIDEGIIPKIEFVEWGTAVLSAILHA